MQAIFLPFQHLFGKQQLMGVQLLQIRDDNVARERISVVSVRGERARPLVDLVGKDVCDALVLPRRHGNEGMTHFIT
jgi:hypothetical protein